MRLDSYQSFIKQVKKLELIIKDYNMWDNHDKLWKYSSFFSIMIIVMKEDSYEKENFRRYSSKRKKSIG
jgi:hypothetical protein